MAGRVAVSRSGRGRARRAWRCSTRPPAGPQYNGAIEASIAGIAARVAEAAAWAGHPAYWTRDDIAPAWVQANLVPTPGGPPIARWAARARITTRERRRFACTLAQHAATLARVALGV